MKLRRGRKSRLMNRSDTMPILAMMLTLAFVVTPSVTIGTTLAQSIDQNQSQPKLVWYTKRKQGRFSSASSRSSSSSDDDINSNNNNNNNNNNKHSLPTSSTHRTLKGRLRKNAVDVTTASSSTLFGEGIQRRYQTEETQKQQQEQQQPRKQRGLAPVEAPDITVQWSEGRGCDAVFSKLPGECGSGIDEQPSTLSLETGVAFDFVGNGHRTRWVPYCERYDPGDVYQTLEQVVMTITSGDCTDPDTMECVQESTVIRNCEGEDQAVFLQTQPGIKYQIFLEGDVEELDFYFPFRVVQLGIPSDIASIEWPSATPTMSPQPSMTPTTSPTTTPTAKTPAPTAEKSDSNSNNNNNNNNNNQNTINKEDVPDVVLEWPIDFCQKNPILPDGCANIDLSQAGLWYTMVGNGHRIRLDPYDCFMDMDQVTITIVGGSCEKNRLFCVVEPTVIQLCGGSSDPIYFQSIPDVVYSVFAEGNEKILYEDFPFGIIQTGIPDTEWPVTEEPTMSPIVVTDTPTASPTTSAPTMNPTTPFPTTTPTNPPPTANPTTPIPTDNPTMAPTKAPTFPTPPPTDPPDIFIEWPVPFCPNPVLPGDCANANTNAPGYWHSMIGNGHMIRLDPYDCYMDMDQVTITIVGGSCEKNMLFCVVETQIVQLCGGTSESIFFQTMPNVLYSIYAEGDEKKLYEDFPFNIVQIGIPDTEWPVTPSPTKTPTSAPTDTPTSTPTTKAPTTPFPTDSPTENPTNPPTENPTTAPVVIVPPPTEAPVATAETATTVTSNPTSPVDSPVDSPLEDSNNDNNEEEEDEDTAVDENDDEDFKDPVEDSPTDVPLENESASSTEKEDNGDKNDNENNELTDDMNDGDSDSTSESLTSSPTDSTLGAAAPSTGPRKDIEFEWPTDFCKTATIPPECSGLDLTSKGIWYRFVGTGHRVELRPYDCFEEMDDVIMTILAGSCEKNMLQCVNPPQVIPLCRNESDRRERLLMPSESFFLQTIADVVYSVFLEGNQRALEKDFPFDILQLGDPDTVSPEATPAPTITQTTKMDDEVVEKEEGDDSVGVDENPTNPPIVDDLDGTPNDAEVDDTDQDSNPNPSANQPDDLEGDSSGNDDSNAVPLNSPSADAENTASEAETETETAAQNVGSDVSNDLQDDFIEGSNPTVDDDTFSNSRGSNNKDGTQDSSDEDGGVSLGLIIGVALLVVLLVVSCCLYCIFLAGKSPSKDDEDSKCHVSEDFNNSRSGTVITGAETAHSRQLFALEDEIANGNKNYYDDEDYKHSYQGLENSGDIESCEGDVSYEDSDLDDDDGYEYNSEVLYLEQGDDNEWKEDDNLSNDSSVQEELESNHSDLEELESDDESDSDLDESESESDSESDSGSDESESESESEQSEDETK